MNEKKIAFIICMNDEAAYAECKYYIDHLSVPEGYELDVLAITEAPSMTAGYNAGMQSTDAKYKVYMHQDVQIVNWNFIQDMLNVFEMDERIGLIGMIGTKHLDNDVKTAMNWDTGKILHNCSPSRLEYEMESSGYQEVEAVDGLLLATQFDVPWREDIFDGWDYYDISQCMEFLRRGKMVVVPYQAEPWVWHDNLYSKMNRYYDYAKLFAKEYSDIHPFVYIPVSERIREYHELKEKMRKEMLHLIDLGKRKEVVELFRHPANRGYLHLKEIQIIADIEYLEAEHGVRQRLWRESDSAQTLLKKIREVKYMLKRIEFGLDSAEVISKWINVVCSPYVIDIVLKEYTFK